MQHSFFKQAGPFSLSDIAKHVGASLPHNAADLSITCVRTLDEATAKDLTFFENRKYLGALENTKAAACLVSLAFVKNCPASTIPLVVEKPNLAFGKVLSLFFPDSLTPQPVTSVAPTKTADNAKIGEGTLIAQGAVIGQNVQIGQRCQIGANCVIGDGVEIGDDTVISPACVLQHCHVGARTILHPGAKIGQDGFGYVFDGGQHLKVPQIGRVIIGDNVEIGANTTIDRGALRDTIIGDGTKIDNLVQIGHNVQIGKNCIIVGHVGVSGSVILEDYVMIGGKSSIAGHVTIGKGAQIAAVSTVKDDVPPGARYGGVPAKPVKQWFREMAALSQLASRDKQG